jgi:hypothetical protein
MVVDHPDRLHERVANGRPHEPEPAPLEISGHPTRQIGLRRELGERAPPADDRATVDERPEIRVEASEFLLRLENTCGVCDGRLDLEPVADDPRILEQPLDVFRLEPCDDLGVESCERTSIPLPLAEDREPREARLGSFERQKLVEVPVVVRRDAPLLVVVLEHLGIPARRPFPARDAHHRRIGSHAMRWSQR